MLKLNVSWVFAGLLTVLHAGALVIALTVPLPWTVRVVLGLLIGLSGYHSARRYAFHQGAGAVQALEVDPSGEWRLAIPGDTLGPCRILACYIYPWVVVVQLRCQARRWPVGLVLAADAVEPELFRALRVRLRAQHYAG